MIIKCDKYGYIDKLTKYFKFMIIVLSTIGSLILLPKIIYYIHDLFLPIKFKISINNLIIYRTNDAKFPICEFDLVTKSLPRNSSSIVLKSLKIFREGVRYDFPTGLECVNSGPGMALTKRIVFSDNCLNNALKIPPDSNTINLCLDYYYFGFKNEIDSVFLGNGTLVKCTYLLNPYFDSIEEGKQYTDWNGGMDLFWHDTLSVSHHTIGHFFFDKYTVKEISMEGILNEFTNNRGGFVFNYSSFKKRIGGIYLGMLKSDMKDFKETNDANILMSLGEKEKQEIFGVPIKNIANMKEFVYLNYDSIYSDEIYTIYQLNCNYFVDIIYDDIVNIEDAKTYLRNYGYKVGATRSAKFDDYFSKILYITQADSLDNLYRYLNALVGDINTAIKEKKVIIFIPKLLDKKTEKAISVNIENALNCNDAIVLSFECGLLRIVDPEAFMSTPILVRTPYSENNRNNIIDSIAPK
jgi:hypothetical protein